MKPLRVLIVEDSLTVRKRLCEIVQADPQLTLVGEAEDGKQAIEQCLALRPDIVSLDMMLPQMSGLAVTEYLMAYCPTPILIVSSSFNRGELFRTYEALAAGALEAIDKPAADAINGHWERHFVAMIKLVARVKVITHLRGRRAEGQSNPRPTTVLRPRASAACTLIAIGASTGGPHAVVEVLRALPHPCPLPILIVLHLNEAFGAGFAEWLDGQTPHAVRFAPDGGPLTRGVWLAPPGRHLIVEQQNMALRDNPERHSCRPSVDVLFESLARTCGAKTAACLLTGMGQDGAQGLLAIRQTGGLTIAQDEASSVVYGMPREAALLNAAELILPLGEIGPRLALETVGRK